jgi:phage-related protein
MKSMHLGNLQIHSNSINLDFTVNDHSGLDSPDIRLSSYNRPGEHGAIVSNQLYGGRTITIQGRIAGSSMQQYMQNRRSLQNTLRIIKDANTVSQPVLLRFQTTDDLQLQASIYAASKFDLREKSPIFCEFFLELFAADPNLYDQSLQVATVTPPAGGGATYPVIYPVNYSAKTGGSAVINNAGDANTYPLLTFTGPLTSPFVINTTTGETFKVNATLNTGDTLLCDMTTKTMLLNTTTNAMNYFDPSNIWMSLQPGDNNITFGTSLSSDTGNVSVSFRSAYIGV